MAKTAKFHVRGQYAGLWVVTEGDKIWFAVQGGMNVVRVRGKYGRELNMNGRTAREVIEAIAEEQGRERARR